MRLAGHDGEATGLSLKLAPSFLKLSCLAPSLASSLVSCITSNCCGAACRALAGPTLYTDIDVGGGSKALYSGGPPASGPSALAGTTWWNIRR
jgi:hypothetical protein